MSTGRRRYLYTVALLSYVALLISLIMSSRELIRLLLADSPSQDWLLALPRSALAPWLLAAGVAAIIWVIHWFLANRPARALTMSAAGERASSVRKAYLYLGQGAALALIVAQAWTAVADVIKLGFGLPDSDPTPASARLFALAVGAIIALIFWGYLRWETVRDGDFGRESSHAANWRRAYFYLAALAGSTLAMVGAGESVRRLVVALTNSSARGEGWQVLLANSLAALAIGAPLAFAAWGTANRLARNAPALEMNALSRVLLRYGVLLFGTLATLLAAGYLLAQVLMLALGRLLGPYWPTALAYLPVGLITWLICAPAIRLDVALGGETARTATIRRLERYTVAGLALAAFWLGLTEFVRLILLAVLRVRPADPAVAAAWWTRFAYAAAMVFVAAPAWWGHWWSQQVRARGAGPAGHAERASGIRQFYLYAVTLVGAAITLAALGLAVFLFLNRNETGAMGTRAALAGAGAAAVVSLLWAAAHGLTLRGDARLLAADRGGERACGGCRTRGGGRRTYQGCHCRSPAQLSPRRSGRDGSRSGHRGAARSPARGHRRRRWKRGCGRSGRAPPGAARCHPVADWPEREGPGRHAERTGRSDAAGGAGQRTGAGRSHPRPQRHPAGGQPGRRCNE